MFEQVKFKIVGSNPGLLMGNKTLADPLHKLTQEYKRLTKKKGSTRTEEDIQAIADLEFTAHLYLNKEGAPIVPAVNWESCLVAGAKRAKLGKLFKAAVFVEDDTPIQFSGPKDMKKRMRDPSCYDRSKTKRGTFVVRPLFRDWTCTLVVGVDTKDVEVNTLMECLSMAGKYEGVGAWRPRFGRFTCEVLP